MQLQQGGGSWTDDSDEWVITGRSATVGDLYEVRLTQVSGSPTNGGGLTLGTWYRIDSTREYTFSYPASANGIFNMQLRRYSDGTALRNKNIEMYVEAL